MTVRPVFLFALPRSGSTLAQRVIAAHDEVATTSEPWILLPMLYSLRRDGVRAEYWHQATAAAVEDFCEALPDGRESYLRAVRELALTLYADASPPGSTYFLDKTPRYHFIARDIIRLFPDAKLVFLWRHPLSVLASLLETFCDGRFQPYDFRRDLVEGPANLVAAWEACSERGCAVRYEDLVTGEAEWRRVFEYLELDFDPGVFERFRDVRVSGRYGDPSGVRLYRTLSDEPVSKWASSLQSPVRKAWARRYLRRLGSSRLATMGYSLDQSMRELNGISSKPRKAPGDALALGRSALRQQIRDVALRIPEASTPRGPDYPSPDNRWRRSAATIPRIAARLRGPGGVSR